MFRSPKGCSFAEVVMPADNLEQLNNQFALPDQLSFVAHSAGLPMAAVHNAQAAATIALQGGHVVTFRPHEHAPVLWVSQWSQYVPGKAIRGGIPICWPWFGPHPSDKAQPAHGFARTQMWQVMRTGMVGAATQLELSLNDTPATRTMWPHAFQLTMVITVGTQLQVELRVHNPGTTPWTYTGALHSYFNVGNVADITIQGLDGRSFIDQLDPARRKVQAGPVRIAAEMDRMYLDTLDTCTINDPRLHRQIEVRKGGSHSTVVWNPWIDKAQRLADFGDTEYRTMVCIETANAGDNQVTVLPGDEHRLQTVITVAHL